MKTFCLSITPAVFFFLLGNGILAQEMKPALDQLKLAQSFIGTWEQKVGKDTVLVDIVQQYGKAFVENVYLVINGNKSDFYINEYFYSIKDGKFKGFVIWPGGFYQTWFGSFINEKKFIAYFVKDFNPETASGRMEMEFDSPISMTIIQFDKDGIKTEEGKSSKVK